MDRREFLVGSGFVGMGLLDTHLGARASLSSLSNRSRDPGDKAVGFTLPALPYSYDALEPYIDARTMQIHHDKHHGAYVANLNKALEGYPELQSKSIDDLMKELDSVPEKIRIAVQNNGGGHWNHSLFWQLMKKNGGGEPWGNLADAVNSSFGSFVNFKDVFKAAALALFGSGWVWLIEKDGKLGIGSTPNQDTPYMLGAKAILGLDVWEHAYYLKHQNMRSDYIDAWWHVVNWDKALDLYAASKYKPKANN
jgi:superoxide dismutase, Fe-Mn family